MQDTASRFRTTDLRLSFFLLSSRVRRTLKERHNNRDGRGLLIQVGRVRWCGCAGINDDHSLGLVHTPRLALRRQVLMPTVQSGRNSAMVEACLRVQRVPVAAHAEAGW